MTEVNEVKPPGRPKVAARPRNFSLVHQASCETQHFNALRRQRTINHRNELESGMLRGKQILQKLNDEGIELIWAADGNERIRFAALLSSSAPLPEFIGAIVKSFHACGISLNHLETRRSKKKRNSTEEIEEFDVLADCDGTKDELIGAASNLIQEHNQLTNFALYKRDPHADVPWFPRHISELDKCSNCVTKYEPTTDPRHPGNGDDVYIARRKFLNDQASQYKHGQPFPIVDYSEAEHATWKAVFEKLCNLHGSHTCSTYRKNLQFLLDEGVITTDRIPQLRRINEYLQKKTGFILRPCSGLLSARDFLASLAFRVFQTTTYLRHGASPHHSPEPDLIHELLGHVPMFADPLIAQMSQDIGLMSLGATDEQIEKLATVYWFIIEFGLCREDGKLKAIGAGLLSAYGELMHACSDAPEHREFDPAITAVQKYEDSDYQPLYFVANSIQDALVKLRQFALSMERPFSVVYNPFTQSVEVIEQTFDLDAAFARLRMEFSSISHAIDKLNTKNHLTNGK
ncbi:hypothetical protein WR25_17729 [Diploscapter pachys]|uniref:Biopterin-dependent aromatic amino acid hydroxylase family profile domain-containing protein n=1 Tax=Diploscapter pachys TaxID=2018661 RepID=A0A2A2LPY4_9BILA|nr:hypothetical protein WR25_17729 [Diploscapter pachys]